MPKATWLGLRKGIGNGPKLLISAHLDTVFPAGTDVKVKQRDGKLHAPGISDDTRGLAVPLSWLKVLNDNKVQTVGDLLFVGNVGEEELGNLRGMKRIFDDHLRHRRHGRAGAGARRQRPGPRHRQPPLRGHFKGPGGHSYAAFGQVPSAIHGMGRAIAKIAEIRRRPLPRPPSRSARWAAAPRSTPSRPTRTWRSTSAPTQMEPLLETEKKILAAIDEAVAEENKRWNVNTLSVRTS